MIKCACKENSCKIGIKFDWYSRALWFTDKTGSETLMYLDANTIINLIKELKYGLIELTEVRD